MKIHGLQKMTLLDFPGHVACTVFLGGCDLRCPYCHNYELATGQAPAVMDEEELFAFLAKRKGLLDGVAITGGEPCLHRDLPEFIAKICELGFPVKLDTNGTHPAVLREVLEQGLVEYVAMDVKNSPSKYALTAGVRTLDLAPISESIELLKSSGSRAQGSISCSALRTEIQCPTGGSAHLLKRSWKRALRLPPGMSEMCRSGVWTEGKHSTDGPSRMAAGTVIGQRRFAPWPTRAFLQG